MKRSALIAALLLASTQLFGVAQDAAKSTAKPAEAKAADKATDKKADVEKKADDKKPEPKKSTNRLPNNYGKLSLTDAQKTKIYGVQDKHEGEIETLNDKLKAAKAKRDAEIEAVLTPEQKKTLKELAAARDEKDDDKGKDAKDPSDKKDKK